MKNEKEILESSEMFQRNPFSGTGGVARASAVNRMHRVVRAMAPAFARDADAHVGCGFRSLCSLCCWSSSARRHGTIWSNTM